MAAKTASVSYAHELAPEVLEQVLASGDVPPSFAPHLAHFAAHLRVLFVDGDALPGGGQPDGCAESANACALVRVRFHNAIQRAPGNSRHPASW